MLAGSKALRHQVRRDGLTGRDSHRATALFTVAANIKQRCVYLFEQPFHAGGQLLARLGQHDFARRPVQQANANFIFQLFYAVAYG